MAQLFSNSNPDPTGKQQMTTACCPWIRSFTGTGLTVQLRSEGTKPRGTICNGTLHQARVTPGATESCFFSNTRQGNRQAEKSHTHTHAHTPEIMHVLHPLVPKSARKEDVLVRSYARARVSMPPSRCQRSQ